MQYPLITLNGDRATTLVEQNLNVCVALNEALEIAHEAAPHGRNFQTQNHLQDYDQARKEHVDRIERLKNILHEFELIANHCGNYLK